MSLQSPNRNSILGWVKNFKKLTLSNDSVNEIPDDINDEEPSANSISHPINIYPNNSNSNNSNILGTSFPNSPKAQEFLRPLLHHKSRSTNNVDRVRLNSETSQSLRQHRDSFLQINPLVDENSKYFGIPLSAAINIAHAKISILNNDTNSNQVLQYGKIPIVVAKCGVYLKKKGLNVEGIFRVGGSSKRLKDLQLIFNSPPDFGKKLNWDGYNVHDAASILRRYLNALPEPLISLDLYETFRAPLSNRPRIINYMKFKAENPHKSLKDIDSIEFFEINNSNVNSTSNSNVDLPDVQEANHKKNRKNYKKLTKDVHNAIQEYKILVDQLPLLSKQLLFYILDLLAMVQNHAAENLMSSRNLAAIFQPSILSHPNHDLDPIEYALSQVVVEFLIQYAYKLLPNQQELKKNVSSKNLSQMNSTSKLNLQSSSIIPNSSTDESEKPKPTNLLIPPNSSSNYRRQHSRSVSSNREEDYVSTNIGQVERPYIDSEGDYNMGQNLSDGSSDDEVMPNINEVISAPPDIVVESIEHKQDEFVDPPQEEITPEEIKVLVGEDTLNSATPEVIQLKSPVTDELKYHGATIKSDV